MTEGDWALVIGHWSFVGHWDLPLVIQPAADSKNRAHALQFAPPPPRTYIAVETELNTAWITTGTHRLPVRSYA